MRYEEVTEAPQKIVISSPSYDDPAYNARFAARQRRRISEIIEQASNYVLARTGDGFNGYIIAFSADYSKALYVIRYAAKRWSWLPMTVTQIELWRSSTAVEMAGVTRHVFFDILLPRYSTILSDRQQSELGKRFWDGRMADAAHRGQRVGIANMVQKKVVWYQPAQDGYFDNWLRDQDGFGTQRWYQAIRYIISADP